MCALYSHPGKLLKDHLYNVYRLGLKKFLSKELYFENLEELKLLTELVLITHDFGKANKYFQRKLEFKKLGREDDEEYKLLNQAGINKSNHSLLSAVCTYYIADELFKDKLLPLIAMVIVLRHHGNLKDFTDMISITEWELLEEQYQTFDLEELQTILNLSQINVNISGLTFNDIKAKLSGRPYNRIKIYLSRLLNKEENYLILNLIYSILISSDKADAIFYSKGLNYEQLEEMVLARRKLPADAADKYKKFKGWDQASNKMDKKRNQIYQEVIHSIENIDLDKERILSINVPTGTGKTLAALSAGLRLREKVGQNFRLIYTLPFTSIIDQNYERYEDVFARAGEVVDSSLLIKHHYLTPKSYIKKDVSGEELYDDEDYDVSKHLIESWNSEIIVTTFVQLLHSIFSNKNSNLIKFNNISNSIILLDEVQSIPYKYWELIKIIFKEMAKKLNCYFIFITATMPLIYSEENGEIKELAVNKEEYFDFFDRIVLDLSHYRKEMTLEVFKEFISEELVKYPGKNILIILNTIKSSIEIYEHLVEEIEQDKEELIYLSTNIVPKEREERIKQIGTNDKRQIIVSTQMVEAGVDIDLDRVYRDFAPLDSINQSCGRCNRNFDPAKKGTVILLKLLNENDRNKPFAKYVYGDILRVKTDLLLAELPDSLDEKKFFEINKKYFELVNSAKRNDISIDLLKFIKNLKYQTAFFSNHKSVFQLIEQDYETVNLFIELDQDAVEIWQRYQEINEIEIKSPEDFSIRRSRFEVIKKDFLNYVITIPKYVAKKQLDDGQLENNFNYVNFYQVKDVYRQETGFKRDEVELCSFF